MLFSDEKIFNAGEVSNPQNDRISSSSLTSNKYRIVKRVQKLRSVMVCAGISPIGDSPGIYPLYGKNQCRNLPKAYFQPSCKESWRNHVQQ